MDASKSDLKWRKLIIRLNDLAIRMRELAAALLVAIGLVAFVFSSLAALLIIHGMWDKLPSLLAVALMAYLALILMPMRPRRPADARVRSGLLWRLWAIEREYESLARHMSFSQLASRGFDAEAFARARRLLYIAKRAN